MAEAGTLPAAGLWRRFMSIAYECVLLFGVLFFFGYAFSSLTQYKGHPGPALWAFQAFITLVLATYFGWFWSDGRQTLPMKTMQIRLTGPGDATVGRGRALARFAAALGLLVAAAAAGTYVHGALWLLLLASPVWAFFDRDHQAPYDRIAGTRLVHVAAASGR
jgi:uncharacterized RDD family membrane protein YckC